jgi:hypothetical protein
MPAVAARIAVWAEDRPVTAHDVQIIQVKKALAFAEPGIGLLKNHDICVELKYHIFDAEGIEYPVIPHAFVNIIRGNRQLRSAAGAFRTADRRCGPAFQLGEPWG